MHKSKIIVCASLNMARICLLLFPKLESSRKEGLITAYPKKTFHSNYFFKLVLILTLLILRQQEQQQHNNNNNKQANRALSIKL